MSHRIHILFLILAPCLLLADAEPVQLRYMPGQPVLQTNEVEVRIFSFPKQEEGSVLPILHASQRLQAVLEVQDHKQTPLKALPLDIRVNLRALEVAFTINGHTLRYAMDDPDLSPFMAQVAQTADKPVQIRVAEDFTLDSKASDVLQLIRELEALAEFSKVEGFTVNSLLTELFQQTFALAGQELFIGKSYNQAFAFAYNKDNPFTITYTILDISENKVNASIHGGFAPMRFFFASPLISFHSAQKQSPELTLRGKVEGQVSWDLQNALLYKTQLTYTYEGTLIQGDQTFPIQVQIHRTSQTKAE